MHAFAGFNVIRILTDGNDECRRAVNDFRFGEKNIIIIYYIVKYCRRTDRQTDGRTLERNYMFLKGYPSEARIAPKEMKVYNLSRRKLVQSACTPSSQAKGS